jgi:hypothetical protein
MEIGMKINLSDITLIDDVFFNKEDVNLLQYRTVVEVLKNDDKPLSVISLLLCLREQKGFFEKIIEKEIDTLFESHSASGLEDVFALGLFYDILTDTSFVHGVFVFDSLRNLPETKMIIAFAKEIIQLRELISDHLFKVTIKYDHIDPSHEHYAVIGEKSVKLLKLINSLKKMTQTEMQRSAQDFLSNKSLEEQMSFFALFFSKHVSERWDNGFLLPSNTNNTNGNNKLGMGKKEDFIEVTIDNESACADEFAEKGGEFDKKELIENAIREALKETADKTSEDTALRVIGIIKPIIEDIKRQDIVRDKQIDSLNEKVLELSGALMSTLERLDEFLLKQKRAEEILREKHNIKL